MTTRRITVRDWARARQATIWWCLLVVLVHGAVTIAVASTERSAVSRAMTLAIHFGQGRLDLGPQTVAADTVTVNGATYWVVGPLTFVPFLPFEGLWQASRWLVSRLLESYRSDEALALLRPAVIEFEDLAESPAGIAMCAQPAHVGCDVGRRAGEAGARPIAAR